MRALLAYVRPHRSALIVAGVLGLLGAAAGLAQPLAAREVIEALAEDEPVWRAIVLLTALVIGAAFVTAVHFWVLERTAQRIVLRARRGLTGRVLRLRMAELDGLAPGDLVARATSDTTLLGEVASTGLVQSFNGVVSLIGADRADGGARHPAAARDAARAGRRRSDRRVRAAARHAGDGAGAGRRRRPGRRARARTRRHPHGQGERRRGARGRGARRRRRQGLRRGHAQRPLPGADRHLDRAGRAVLVPRRARSGRRARGQRLTRGRRPDRLPALPLLPVRADLGDRVGSDAAAGRPRRRQAARRHRGAGGRGGG